MVEFGERVQGATIALSVAGDVDIASADEFRDRLLGCLKRADSLEVDLGAVTFIDSSGLAGLVRLRTEAEILDKEVALVNLSPATARLLELTGLQGLFKIDLPHT